MNIKNYRNIFISISGLSLLFLMMAFISQLYIIKIVLMVLLLLFVEKKLIVSTNVIIAYLLIFFYGVYGIFIGVIFQTENPLVFATIYCVWPLLYMFYSGVLVKDVYFKQITKVVFIAHTFIVLYDLLYAGGVFFGINIPNIYTVEIPFSIYEDATRMNFVNLNTLTFTTPVLFILILGKYDLGISRIIQFIVLICTFFLLVISGRRSVMLIIAVLPFVPFFFSRIFSKGTKKILIKGAMLLLVLFFSLFWYIQKNNDQIIDNYTQIFLNAFDASKEPIKFAQQKMFVEKFEEKPFFGHGSGNMFYEPSPGRMILANQFELSYHHKLANTGIIGFTIIIGVYLWILIYGIYLSHKKNDLLFLSFLVGFFFMLIADATNPVLCSFDLIWPIYLCLSRINYLELMMPDKKFDEFMA